jgi:hypothetical protein
MEQSTINSIVLESLNGLKNIKRKQISFPKLLGKSNPYTLAVNCNTAESLVDFILSSHIQTSSKTIWGNYLEIIALEISKLTIDGYKSKEECTDIEWELNGFKNYRGWKSSPNWCNADQKRAVNLKESQLKNNENFGSFKVLTSYGKTSEKRANNGFVQLSGQDAWFEVGLDDETYNKVMISIKDNSKMIGQFLENIYISDKEKIITWVEDNFLNEDDTINFIKINKYVSGRDNIKVTKW